MRSQKGFDRALASVLAAWKRLVGAESKKGHSLLSRRPKFEPLEDRTLLTASPPAQQITGELWDALRQQASQYNEVFYVYQNRDAGGNHFIPSWYTNGAAPIHIDPGYVRGPGDTCVQVTWNGGAGLDGWHWDGIGFEEPEGYFSEGVPGKPYRLFDGQPAPQGTRLLFDARLDAKDADDAVEFGFGDPSDSSGAVRQWQPLGTLWAGYSIDLSGRDLSSLHLGFLASVNDVHDDAGNGVTFYVDNIRYEWPRSDAARLVQSYNVRPDLGTSFDVTHANTAYAYDQVVTLMALGRDEDPLGPGLSARVGDGLLDAMNHDWTQNPGALAPPDGVSHPGKRLYDAYMSGDPLDNQNGNSRPAGWWDDQLGWLIHNYGLDAGVNAWAVLGFLDLYGRTGNPKYLGAAHDIATWIDSVLKDPNGGFRIGWKPDGSGGWIQVNAKSVEHHVDLYAAFSRLSEVYQAQGDESAANFWHQEALHAGGFVMSMFDPVPGEGHFYIGTDDQGNPNEGPYILDVQTWSYLALAHSPDFAQAIDWTQPIRWVESQLAFQRDDGITGFDFGYDSADPTDHAPDGIWWEGTAQMAAVYAAMGDLVRYQQTMQSIQQYYQQEDTPLIHASDRPDGLSTGIVFSDGTPWRIPQREAIGASSWVVMAGMRFNPLGLESLAVAPRVASINRSGATPTNATSVQFAVTFSDSVTGVDSEDFALALSGATGAIDTVSGSGADYTVSVKNVGGNGTLGLNLVDNDSIEDLVGSKLGGTGTGNGNFTGQTYTIDTTPPIGSLNAPKVTKAGDTRYTFSVIYTDSLAVNVATLDSFDLRVTGPDQYSQTATFDHVDTNTDGTPREATYWITPPDGMWTSTANGTYAVSMQSNQVTDTSGNPLPAGTLGTFAVKAPQDRTAPKAALAAHNVTTTGDTRYAFTVTYTDNLAIDISTLGGSDILVTGPNRFRELAAFDGVDFNTNGTPRTATYWITPPGGSWNAANNGVYAVSMQSKQVRDLGGKAVASGKLGTFTVDTAPPTALLTASNVTKAGGKSYTFTVTYKDNLAVKVSTLDNLDLLVTGPDGPGLPAKFVGVNARTNGALRRARYRITPPGGAWSPANNGVYTVAIQSDQVNDTAGNALASGNLGTFIVDTAPPTALLTASNVTIGGGTTYTFTVTYADNLAVNVSTLDNSDLRVTGPKRYRQLATLVSVDTSADGTPRTATYQITPPQGSWSALNNGVYTVSMQSRRVKDIGGNSVASGKLGTFTVNVPSAAGAALFPVRPHRKTAALETVFASVDDWLWEAPSVAL